MRSLRERKSRPSYASLAGLEHISDQASGSGSGSDVEENGDPDESVEPSGNGMPADESQAVSQSGEDGNETETLSSGDSSEFQPDDDEGRKKRKGKGKVPLRAIGQSATPAVEQSDSDDMPVDDDSVEEDMVPDEDDREIIKVPKKRGSKPKNTRQEYIIGEATGSTPSYAIRQPGTKISIGQGDTTMLPQAYKEVIRASADILTKGDGKPSIKSTTRDADRWKTFGLETLATGPQTPFVRRLKGDPRTLDAEVSYDMDDPDVIKRLQARRTRLGGMDSYLTLKTPWQVWEGDGLWMGMFDPEATAAQHTGKGKGKQREGGEWKLREEVSLRFEGVGRFTFDDLHFLSETDASAFLPDPKPVICHIGPHGSQTRSSFSSLTAQSLSDPAGEKEGFIFATGGPIWGVDFCPSPSDMAVQYLAITTLASRDHVPKVGQRDPPGSRGAIQIWSFERGSHPGQNGSMKCEMIIGVEGGAGMECKWMPVGASDRNERETSDRGRLPKLGILSVIQLDGSVSFYSIPDPQAIRAVSGAAAGASESICLYFNKPLLRLEIPDAMCICMDWITGERLVVGLSNGHGAVWDIGDALRNGQQDEILPSHYFTLAMAAIKTVSASRAAPGDLDGNPLYDEEPYHVVFGSYDGFYVLVDLRDSRNPVDLFRQRNAAMASAWSSQLLAPLIGDVDHVVCQIKVHGLGKGRSFQVAAHRGPIWASPLTTSSCNADIAQSIGTSDYHTMVASGSTDGSVILSNNKLGFHRKRKLPMLYHRLFELDYDQQNEEYRMLDDFLPETVGLAQASERHTPKGQKEAAVNPAYVTTPLWTPQMGVNKVTWFSTGGLRNAGWLAAGTASGLGRLEWVEGKFAHGRVPSEFAQV